MKYLHFSPSGSKLWIHLFAAVLLACGAGTASRAEQAFEYPSDAPALGIAFPDDWDVEVSDDEGTEVLTATSPEEDIEIELWPLDEEELADDPKAAIDAAVEEVNEIIEEYVDDFEVATRETMTVNGVYIAEVTGTGKDVETTDSVEVSVDIMTPDDKHVLIMMYWGEVGAKEANQDALVQIVKSLKKLGGKSQESDEPTEE